jgi:hypothetical protein
MFSYRMHNEYRPSFEICEARLQNNHTQQKRNHWSDDRDVLLTFLKSFVALLLFNPPPPSVPNILQPQKFDSTPYNSQGHLHLRLYCVESCCER